MKTINFGQLETAGSRQSFALLVLAVTYGIVAGAIVTMYYEVVPDMAEIEDRLGSPLAILYILAVGSALIHLPRLLQNLRTGSWRPAFRKAGLLFGPLFVFLGTDGLIAHLLWWGPLSSTDRYHILHHTVIAGIPLTLLYGLVQRRWLIDPSDSDGPVAKNFIIAATVIAILLSLMVGVLFGAPPAGLILITGLLASVIYSIAAGRSSG